MLLPVQFQWCAACCDLLFLVFGVLPPLVFRFVILRFIHMSREFYLHVAGSSMYFPAVRLSWKFQHPPSATLLLFLLTEPFGHSFSRGVCFSHQPSVSVWLRGSLTIQSLFRLTSLLCEQFKLGMARLQPCRIKREESADSSVPSSCIFVCLICFLHPSNSKGFCRDKTQLGNVPRRPQQTYT